MKIYKSKLMRVLNFIKNEGKYERGDMVKVKETIELGRYYDRYIKYINKLGIVVGIDYTKKDYIVGVKFEDGLTFDFKIEELEKIQPENPVKYKKIKIEI